MAGVLSAKPLGNEDLDFLTDQFAVGIGEQRFGLRIDLEDGAVAVHRDHGIGDGFEELVRKYGLSRGLRRKGRRRLVKRRSCRSHTTAAREPGGDAYFKSRSRPGVKRWRELGSRGELVVAAGFGDAVLADLVQQSLVADFKEGSSLLAIPVGLFEGLGNGTRFRFVLGAARQGF